MASGGGSVWDQHAGVDGSSQALGIFIGETRKSLEAVTEGLREMRDDFKAFVVSMETYKATQSPNSELKQNYEKLEGRVKDLETWKITFTAKLSAYAGLGGAAGSGIVMAFAHFWK
jgi:hypothetical protein